MSWLRYVRFDAGGELTPLPEMVEKAERLLKQGRVVSLDESRYNIVGDHGTYLVQVQPDGHVSCTCQGFLSKRRCSHVAAVIILRDVKRRRRWMRGRG